MAFARQGRPGERCKPFDGIGDWRCPRSFPGSVIVCICCGPSLDVADLAAVAERHAAGDVRVVCVNDAIRFAPWADVSYAADTSWWDAVGLHVDTGALRVSCQVHAHPSIHALKTRPEVTLERDARFVAKGKHRDPGNPGGPMYGSNSGYQALNVAMHLGARRIVLLGYDMGLGEDGRAHSFGAHPFPLRNPGAEAFPHWIRAFGFLAPELAAAGVEVVNCSRRTALTCFPRAPLEEVLAWP